MNLQTRRWNTHALHTHLYHFFVHTLYKFKHSTNSINSLSFFTSRILYLIIMHFNGWKFRCTTKCNVCARYFKFCRHIFVLHRKSRVKAAHSHVEYKHKKGKNIHHVIPHWIIALTMDWLRLVYTQCQNYACLFFRALECFPFDDDDNALKMMENCVSSALTMFQLCLARFSSLVCVSMRSLYRQYYCFPDTISDQVFIKPLLLKWTKKKKKKTPLCMM